VINPLEKYFNTVVRSVYSPRNPSPLAHHHRHNSYLIVKEDKTLESYGLNAGKWVYTVEPTVLC